MLIDIVSILGSAIFGAIIGSFLNVVVLRFNTGRSISKGRSACFSCNTTLGPFELIPLFSYLLQRGRCRHCTSKISIQYFTVELATALVAVYVFITAGLSIEALTIFAIFCLLIVIVVYDIRHTIIPDELVYTVIALTLFYRIILNGFSVSGFESWLTSNDFIIGPLLFLFFGAFWYFSNGKWMGLGDGKLALALGWFLGASGGLSAIILAFWIGAIWGTVLLLLRHTSLTMKSEIPFAPFLVLGSFIIFVTHWSVLALSYVYQ